MNHIHITELRHNPHCWVSSPQGQKSGKGRAIWLLCWVQKCWQSLWRSSGVQGKEAAKVSLLPELKLLAKLPLAAGALLKRIAENKLGEI